MKTSRIDRRKFIGLFTAAGSMAFIPSIVWDQAKASALSTKIPDIAVVKSGDYYKAAIESVNMLGGINKFVKPNTKVGLLINGAFTNKATFTNPDIAFAILKLCFDAGASEIYIFRANDNKYWEKGSLYETHKELLQKVKFTTGTQKFTIPKGKILKEAEMVKEIAEVDTLINIPISKHHDGSFITCCLKNMMGMAARSTNVKFHSPTKESGLTNEEFLAQCIADLNLVRKPDLHVVDTTVFITTNGPFGPGELKQEDKVIAGTDPVAIDALFASILGLEKGVVLATEYAAKHGLGKTNYNKLNIEEKTIA
jgi:uncharacterized protein (DUF362 family)